MPRSEDRLITGGLIRALLLFAFVVGLALLLLRLAEILVVFLIAIVLAEGLRPLIDALERRGIPRQVARAAVYIALILLIAGTIALLSRPVVTQARAVFADLPAYQAVLQRDLDQLQLDSSLSSQLSSEVGSLAKTAFTVAADLAHGALDAVITLLLSFLWLSGSRPLGGFLLSLLKPSQRELVEPAWWEIAAGFAGYVRGVAVNMIVIGVLAGVAAKLLGLPAPALLGVLAGVTEMIPIVGPIIGAVPAILLGFTVSPWHPLVVAVVYLVIQQVEAHTLVPLVMRRAVGLPPLAIVLALAAGATLGGVGGAIVAVPIAFTVQVVIRRIVAPAVREWNGAG